MKIQKLGLILVAPFSVLAIWSCSDGKDDVVTQVQNKQLSVRDTSIKQATEVYNQGQAGSQVDEAKLLATFQTSLHPLVVQRCSACHASRVAPYFADPDAVKAYTAISQGSKVDFVTTSNSRIVQRLAIEGHNCWSDCVGNSAELLAAVDKWVADSGVGAGSAVSYPFVTPEVVKPDMFKAYEVVATPTPAQGAQPPVVELIFEAETVTLPTNWQVGTQAKTAQIPEAFNFITALRGGNTYTEEEIADAQGIAEFSIMFFVPESRQYHLYANGAGLANNDNEFFFRIDDEKTWAIGGFDGSSSFKYTRFDTRTWEPGPHTITIRQRSANIRIDKFAAITRAPNAGEVLTNLTGLTLKPAPLSNRFMSFDVSALTGVANSQFVVAAEALTAKSYHFTSPFILMPDKAKAFRVQHIRPLINGVFTPQHTHWAGLDFYVKAPFAMVTDIGLTMVADKGAAEDKISFAFEKFDAIDPSKVPEVAK